MKKGLTLIELMIAIALIFIFSSLTLPMGFNFYQESALRDQTRNLENSLRKAQAMAMTGRAESDAGVRIEPVPGAIPKMWQYIIFERESYEGFGERTDTIIPFPIALSVSEADSQADEIEIVFQKLSGLPKFEEGQDAKSIILKLGTLSATITINSQGKIERYEPARE